MTTEKTGLWYLKKNTELMLLRRSQGNEPTVGLNIRSANILSSDVSFNCINKTQMHRSGNIYSPKINRIQQSNTVQN